MEQLLIEYYADNAFRLRRIVDRILKNFGGLSDKDTDDFYSLANEVFADVFRRYDGQQSFDAFLYKCLLNRIKTEMSRRNCNKRTADRSSISLDAPVDESGEITLGDMIAGSFDIEREVFGTNEVYSRRMQAYLQRLSGLQRNILKLSADGYLPVEIREKLNINEAQYADCRAAIRSYRNTSILL